MFDDNSYNKRNQKIRQLLLVAPIAFGAACFSYYSFKFALGLIISNVFKGGDGDIVARLLFAMLVASVVVYALLILSIILSGVLAWLTMRKCKIEQAGKIALLSSLILTAGNILLIKTGKSEDFGVLIEVIAFVAVYVLCSFLISSKR